MSLLLGAIADDFTGATDLANTLVNQGMRAVQLIGVPTTDTDIGDVEAVVVALKSRTAPVGQAVTESLAALDWLRGHGARQIFFKYCSTFDSTAAGNIGPVADALMETLEADIALICPAFPTNARTIVDGNLYVGEQLLSESPMKDHPLTPMRDANLMRLMDAQSRYSSGLIGLATVRKGVDAIRGEFDKLKAAGNRYAVADAEADEDLIQLGEAVANHALVTGGSGIALGLPANFRAQALSHGAAEARLPNAAGRCLVLAGSCSQATRNQIEHAPASWSRRKLDVDAIAGGEESIESLCAWAIQQDPALPLLVYASADPGEVQKVQQRHGVEAAGAMIEEILGGVARRLVDRGFRRLIVAGGETSGAVVNALGIESLRIGPEIDPGVPWTEVPGEAPLALALKSGNFGAHDFFDKAFRMLA